MEAAPAFPIAVTLDAMLRAREQRAARQREALDRFGVPVLSATAVMPGPFKDTPLTRAVMAVAQAEIDALLRRRAWQALFCLPVSQATGPEVLYAIRADAHALKGDLVALEDAHRLGRIWDLDVICPTRGPVSRRALGLAARRCLLCDAPAHECARARRHPLEALMAAIEAIVNGPHAR